VKGVSNCMMATRSICNVFQHGSLSPVFKNTRMKVVEMAELPRLIAYRSAVVVAPICRPDGH
jgi:hypothetical protein